VEKIAAIVNPAAGGGRAARRWRRVERLLGRHDVSVRVLETREHNHATLLTRDAVRSGYRTILSVGGDGTLHEVVNGLMEHGQPRDDVRLGVIPAGTGMDFQRNMGIRFGLRRAVKGLLAGTERRIDIGIAHGDIPRAFINFAEVGLGAAVVAREARFGPAWPGRASFFVAAIEAAMKDDNIAAGISIDGVDLWRGAVTSVVVANGPYFGGGMRIAPPAIMDDGHLDTVVLADFSKLERLTQIWKIYPGVHMKHRKVLWQRASEVVVETDGPAYLDLDGELYTDRLFRFSILHRALRVLG
jgi:diacylglycerol kinase (ATP)